MIWIVAVWHLSDYCGVAISNQITQNITYGVLGAFTFLSGAMLGGYQITSVKDSVAFYKRDYFEFILFLQFLVHQCFYCIIYLMCS